MRDSDAAMLPQDAREVFLLLMYAYTHLDVVTHILHVTYVYTQIVWFSQIQTAGQCMETLA